MNHLVLGIVAHVDAGKTTLSEALLYRTGAIRKLGRVDHGDSQLDFSPLERQRGITIYAKQAVIEHAGTSFSLLDTPGHVDFSTEAERTMQALDYALLVIDGTSGVQSHTKTLWLGPERAVVHVGYNDRKVVRLQRANEFIFNRRFAKFRNEYPGKPPSAYQMDSRRLSPISVSRSACCARTIARKRPLAKADGRPGRIGRATPCAAR